MEYTDNSTGFTSEDWTDLFEYINDKATTPFLGAGLAREYFGSGNELAEKIAEEFDYPFHDTSNLAKVAEFARIKKNDSFKVRKFVADYIKNKKLPNFNDRSEPHRILAKLDLPIYITTNYDHLMFEALKSDGKNPIIESCNWNALAKIQGRHSVFDEGVPHHFDYRNPLVYHIHGEVDNPQSMVLTEDDYLNFIVKLYINIDKLFPSEIRLALASSAIIFIGYSLSDWNLRIILRKIADDLKSASMTHCSIQLTPTDIKSGYENKIKEYLKSYFQIIQGGISLKVFWGTAIDFCQTLSEKSEVLKVKVNVNTS
jgi:SIR2-like domain